MLRTKMKSTVKSKATRATVTRAELDHVGSITTAAYLVRAAS